MDSTSTAKIRHVERCKYRPMFPNLTERENRIIAANGANQTFKHPGDLIMPVLGKTHKVNDFGWH